MELKPFQREAVEAIRRFPHTLLIAPTGSGKSLVFETFLQERAASIRALLISPLNALARQHALKLVARGIRLASAVGRSGVGPLSGPGVCILNPESLSGGRFAAIRIWKPDFMIVDEAHCVWEWGSGFRPAFGRIPGLADELKISKTFWCTATLPPDSRQALRRGLGEGLRELGAFAIPENLVIRRIRSRGFERIDLLRTLIERNRTRSGMIFVNTRAASERIGAYLRNWGIPSVFYHAGMGLDERLALEKRLSSHGDTKKPVWVVATSAFGMGMDYPFLEVCILFEPSFSLLALAQALGRVGRAGRAAESFVFWDPDDFARHEWLSTLSLENRSRLEQVRKWCESPADPRISLEKFFNEGYVEENEHSF